jgi:nitroimidazol reductase NimA-like FMN-containing flavoprotein (pyridoxamine 5'-phosphate oxidase superfamily)
MEDGTVEPMDAIELTEFLGSHETGVLSFAADGRGHALPVQYAFDAERSEILARVGGAPGAAALPTADGVAASFVVEDAADGWTRVVARGSAEPLAGEGVDDVVAERARDGPLPGGPPGSRVVRVSVSELEGLTDRRRT